MLQPVVAGLGCDDLGFRSPGTINRDTARGDAERTARRRLSRRMRNPVTPVMSLTTKRQLHIHLHQVDAAIGIHSSLRAHAGTHHEQRMPKARDGGLRPCGGLIRLLNPRQYRRTSLTKA
jgi:hypothetical protein